MSRWYSISCADCGDEVHASEDCPHEPRYCKPCREERAAKWYDKSCEHCGATIKASHDWPHEPRYCRECKAAYPGAIRDLRTLQGAFHDLHEHADPLLREGLGAPTEVFAVP